jgi:hypothetical protein
LPLEETFKEPLMNKYCVFYSFSSKSSTFHQFLPALPSKLDMEHNRIPTRYLSAVPPFGTEWRPKAIIFDLLTALLDSWTLWNLSAGSAENGHKWRNRYLELTFGCGAYKPYEDLVEQAARDVELDPGVATTLLAGWDKLKPWPEVEGTLEKLRQKGYKMGVVTNCSIILGRRAAALVGRWEGVITAEEVGFVSLPATILSLS